MAISRLIPIIHGQDVTTTEVNRSNLDISKTLNELVDNENSRYENILIITDTKADGTNGGTFTQDVWQTRDLNSADSAVQWCTISSNNLMIGSGYYLIEASAPGYSCGTHKTRLYNVTTSSVIKMGTSEYSNQSGAYAQSRSFVSARIYVTTPIVVSLQHRCSATKSSSGFGQCSSYGCDEVYSIVKITKVA